LGAGQTIQPCKKVIVTKTHKGDQGLIWAVEPYEDDDENVVLSSAKIGKEFLLYLRSDLANISVVSKLLNLLI
jgi:hypothetical protein